MEFTKVAANESVVDTPQLKITALEIEDSTVEPVSPVITDNIPIRNGIREYLTKLAPYLIGMLITVVLCYMNNLYIEMNQLCPYNNDFDCYYRYLLCENDCGLDRPIYKKGYIDFIVENREDEFLLKTRLAGMIFKLVVFALTCSIIFIYSLFNKSSRLFTIVIVINLLVLRFYRDGKAHGDYSVILGNWLLILTSIFTLLLLLAALAIHISAKGKAYGWCVFICIVLFVLVLPGLTIAHRYTTSCANWDLGLYGERLDNTVNCKFDKPHFCLYEFLGDMFDYNKWLMLTCEDRPPHWEYMNNKYPNSSRIGFPIMNNLSKEERKFQTVPKYVMSHLSVVDERNENEYEVILERTLDPVTNTFAGSARFDIKIPFNEHLVLERSILESESLADNVIVIYIDTLSRAAAFRQLKQTMKVLEEMSPKVHQFFKYHSITPYTIGNMFAMFYGISRPYHPLPPPSDREFPSFIHEYKNKGFITARSSSHCALSAIETTFDAENYRFIDEEPFDHIGMGWACDVNYHPRIYEEAAEGPMSIIRRCLYGKEMAEYVIEYGEKFWDTYKNQKKFLWLDFLEFHEGTFTQGKYLDTHLAKFLKKMDLSDTLLLIVSDHGQHVYRTDGLYLLESTLAERAGPALFAKLPKEAEEAYGENLESNKNQIIQAFDIHRLFKAIPNPDQANQTLLYPIPPKTRGCEFPLWEQDCHCRMEKETNPYVWR